MHSEDYNDPFRDTSEYSRPSGARYSSSLATASIILAVISIFCGIFIYIAVPCGALAILFALLSRGDKKMPGRCKVSLALGVVGAVSSIVMTVGAFYMILTNQEMRSEFKQLFNYYAEGLGLDYDFDDLENMFGLDTGSGQPDDSDGSDDYYKNFWNEFYSGSPDGSYGGYSQDYSQDLPGSNGTDPIPDDSSIFSGGEFI